MIRRQLARIGVEPPGGWQFTCTAHGKPALDGHTSPEFRFNVSHSAGMVVAAFTRGREVGVDVEASTATLDYLELSRSYFAPSEILLIEALDSIERRDAFLTIWTLKEAYTKALGLGLATPLGEFAFTLSPPAIHFSPQHSGQQEEWFFYAGQLPSGHRLALAAEKSAGEELACHIEELDLRELLTL